jgi:ubiquinone biosynthesis protein Coq4
VAKIIDDALVEPVARLLLGAADVDGGPTDEQRGVLRAIVAGCGGRTDIDVAALPPLGPDAAADLIRTPEARRRCRELMVLLELCRHPLSETQIARVDEYAAALGESGPGLEMARDLVRSGADTAKDDFFRFYEPRAGDVAEQSLRDRYGGDLAAPDPELGQRLRALHDLPEGTLGYAYIEFYRRSGITVPGDDPHSPAMFVGHDMCHVIAGYEPIGVGEIALGAMQLAITDNDTHWMQFLGNLAVHEAGFLGTDTIVAKEATLARPGATDTLAHAMWRGSQCTGDFTTADHLARADRPLEDVRAEFGVPARTC